MALLQDLIKKIDDETFRQRIMMEMGKFTEQKKFDLVFEEHLLEFIFEVCESDSNYWKIKV